MIPYKVFLPVVGAAVTLALSLTFLVTQVAVALAICITIASALLVILMTNSLVHAVDVFLHWQIDTKIVAFRFIAVGVVTDTGIAVTMEINGLSSVPTALLCLLVLTAAQVLTGGLADAYLGRLRPRLTEARLERLSATKASTEVALAPQTLIRAGGDATEPPETHDMQVMRKALIKVKLGWLVIKKSEALSDENGVLFGIRFEVQITSEAMATKKRTLTTENAEPIAVALSELLNRDLETRWIGIKKWKQAGRYSIIVTTQDVMARIYPFVDEVEWADINTPALIGYGLDARPITLSLRQHGQFIGKTRSGKTSLMNGIIAYITRCENAVVWFCGTEKLYDTLAGWLEIYLDTGEEMPFDFVACGPRDTAECLAALMRVARYRQSLRLHQRDNLLDIICIVGEASFALRNTTITANFDGRELTMSALAGMSGQGAGSAGCWLFYDTQRDTNDQLGPAGGDIQAQVGFKVAFNISEGLSIGRQMGDFQLPPPEHKGEFYIKDDDVNMYPTLTKGRYIQEDDPSKPHLHDGETVSQVSWARRKFKKHLDAGSQQAAGEIYANRHTTVTLEFLDYLRRIDMPSMSNVDDINEVMEKTMDIIDIDTEAIELARGMGLDFATLDAAHKEAFREVVKDLHQDVPGTGPADAPQDAKPVAKNRAELVVQILRDAGRPMASSDLFTAMREHGREVKNDTAVYNLLSQLVAKNVIVKDDNRLYSLPD